MTDLIVIAILLAITGGIVGYLYRAKKRGKTCIGCPYAKQCGSKCKGGCNNKNTEDIEKHD